ncbi:MAG: family efflux transporter [Dehalococcoidia bacterium]|nr:family efflux transporter [Dehalococcoidia bacterium]
MPDDPQAAPGSDGADDVEVKAEAVTTSRGNRGRGARGAGRDLTTGSVPKNLWHLAWPQVIEGILQVADQMVDLVWAGRLPGGFRSVASVGVAQTFSQFAVMGRQGFDQAMRAMISRAVGANNVPLANHVALQAFTLSTAYSVIMVFVGFFLTDVFLRLLGASDALQAETAMYMRIQFIGAASQAFRMMGGGALQAAGDVITPMKATLLSRVIHIILTPFLMFGWWGFPHLGLAGAALSNVIAQLIPCVIIYYALFKGTSRLKLSLQGFRLDFPVIWRIVKIGTPASIGGTERAVGQLVLMGLVSPFGDVALAGYAITRRVEMVANFASMGLGNASGIMVGQNLGANRPDRARQSIGWALVYVVTMKAVAGGIIALFAGAIVMIFTSDPEVVELTTFWLRIQMIAAVVQGLSLVFNQSFNTAGDTLAPMLVILAGMWLVEVPLAWSLIHYTGLGPVAIAYAAIAGFSARIIVYIPYFFAGRWTRVKVI